MLRNPGLVLRRLLQEPGILIAPGVYDGITARLVGEAGFTVAYQSGAGVAASATGQPDIGLMTLTETVSVAKNLASTLGVPLICDADTGYGNALNVIRTVHELEMAGVAAVQLEDQVAPKRCGHLSGKTLVPPEEFVQKLRAALEQRLDSNTLVVARTDARAVEGFEAAVERCKRYIDTGVDVLFFEAPQSVDEVERVADLFGKQIPLLANQLVGGRTPSLTAEELRDMGYKIVIFPAVLNFCTTVLLRNVLERLRTEGTDKGVMGEGNAMDFFNTMGLREWRDLEEKYKV
jgi:2-methylisocitrate lyase-like PEP mutase family enzyme